MTENPLNLFNQTTSGEAAFQTLYVYDKLVYEFDDDEIKVKSIQASESSTFKSDIIVEGNLTSTSGLNLSGDITIGGASGHVGLATFKDARFYGKIFDGDGDFGTSGQLLASDGTDTVWIDASTTSVANANNVGTNLNSTNADQYITFVETTSGNNPIRVDTGLKYNPNSNTLKPERIEFADNNELRFGNSNDLKISHTNSLSGQNDSEGDSVLAGTDWCSYIKETGTGPLVFKSDGGPSSGAFQWYDAGWRPILKLFSGSSARAALYHSGTEKLVTTSTGVEVTGTINATNFSGNGSQLTNIQAGQIVGNSIFVSGMIILWSGASNAVPTGFVLCNGQNNTPDLRGRFVVGFHDSNGDYDVNDTGGSESVTLTVNQIPAHTHTHTKATHPSGSGPEQNQSGGPEDRTNFGDTGTTSSTGGGQSHENRPPYYALCYIMKT